MANVYERRASRNWNSFSCASALPDDRFSRLVFGVLIAAILIGFLVNLLPLRPQRRSP